MTTSGNYDLTWDYSNGDYLRADLAYWGVLAVAIAVFIARGPLRWRIESATGKRPVAPRRTLLVVGIVVVLGVATGGMIERFSHFQQHRQAVFIEQQLHVHVVDPLALPGLDATSFVGTPVQLRASESVSTHETCHCRIRALFRDKSGFPTKVQPDHADGDDHMSLTVACRTPIPTDAAREHARRP